MILLGVILALGTAPAFAEGRRSCRDSGGSYVRVDGACVRAPETLILTQQTRTPKENP